MITSDISQEDSAIKKWNDLYKPLENGFYTPTVEPFANSTTKIVIRSMVVDMAKLNTSLAEKSPHWNELEVYADVLIFSMHSEDYGEFAFKLGGVSNQKATFFARSIIITDGSALFINYNEKTQLIIYAAEITGGTLTFSGLGGNPLSTVDLELEDGSVGFSIDGAHTNAKSIWAIPASVVALGDPAYWLLESSFNVGSALVYTQPDLASKILLWTSLAAGFGDGIELQHLSLDAANLQGYVMQLQRKISFVPLLSEQIYDIVIKNYLDAAQSCETTFNALAGELDLLANVDAFVNANKEYFIDQTDVARQLVEQMKENVDDAEALLDQNSGKLNDLVKLGGSLSQARQGFQDGIDKYKKEQKDKAILGVCMAVLEVGASVAAMAAGDEAAVGTATKGAVDIAKAGKAAEETVGKITQLIEAMKKIAKVIKAIADLIVKLKGAMEAIQNLTTATNLRASDFGNGILVPANQNKDVFDNAYWEVFKINISDVLTPYIAGDVNIDSASTYLSQLQTLAVYGKEVYANQVTVTQLRQKLFKLVLEAEVAKNQKQRLEKLVDQEESKEELIQQAKIMTYQNLLRVKSQVVFYMDEQASALRYWSVKPALDKEVLPSLSDTVFQLKTKLAKIDESRVKAIANFYPTPQPMDVWLTIDSLELIENMKTSGELSLTIPLDRREFRLFGRIRINRFRVYLNDETVIDPDKPIIIGVSTSAHYYDRLGDEQVLEYVSTPFQKPFEYISSDKGNPIADGMVADEFKLSYFEPTPFTTWTVSIKDESPLDLSKLKVVRLRLTGSWVAAGSKKTMLKANQS